MYNVRARKALFLGSKLTRINRTYKKYDIGVLLSKLYNGAVF